MNHLFLVRELRGCRVCGVLLNCSLVLGLKHVSGLVCGCFRLGPGVEHLDAVSARWLLDKCLRPEPSARPSAREVVSLLEVSVQGATRTQRPKRDNRSYSRWLLSVESQFAGMGALRLCSQRADAAASAVATVKAEDGSDGTKIFLAWKHPCSYQSAVAWVAAAGVKQGFELSALADAHVAYRDVRVWQELAGARGTTPVCLGELCPVVLAFLQADCLEVTIPAEGKHVQHGAGTSQIFFRTADCEPITVFARETQLAPTNLRLWVQAFKAVNLEALKRFEISLRRAIQRFGEDPTAANARLITEGRVDKWLFHWVTLQVTPWPVPAPESQRHFDGGPSALHCAITLAGRRTVRFWDKGGVLHELAQKPGDVYLADMTALEHAVGYESPPPSAELHGRSGEQGRFAFRAGRVVCLTLCFPSV